MSRYLRMELKKQELLYWKDSLRSVFGPPSPWETIYKKYYQCLSQETMDEEESSLDHKIQECRKSHG